jgi:putative peptide zinc metalloprotease protein
MNHAPSTPSQPILRRDLDSLVCRGHRRAYRIVVDEIGGRFSRVSERIWQLLQTGEADESVCRQADAAGWTRRRTERKSAAFNPLYVRLPIASIDGVASKLAPWSAWLFAPSAVFFWTMLILVASVLAIGRVGEITVSFGSLQQFFVQSDPVWLGLIFIATKVAHELGHAVVCRRMGSRCGRVGVLLLCGMPCPYCDVTDIWRQASTIKRVAVMSAGIYVELVLAAVATFTWLMATDPVIQLHALNLMVVCGISTLLFNANPLMRYDGYYVLSDLVGSTNLRQDAIDAFRSVVVGPLAGSGYQLPRRRDARSWMLAVYHGASRLYRLAVIVAIASLFLGVAEYFQVRQICVAMLLLTVVVMIGRSSGRLFAVARGTGSWSGVPCWRRTGICFAILLLVGFLLFVPLPRFRTASGWIDVADATPIYLSNDGMIVSVGFDFGDAVVEGDSLVRLSSDSLVLKNAKLQGRLRLASLRRDLARRVSLDRSDTAGQWTTLKAAEQAVTGQLASVRKRISSCDVQAPIDGIVLPATSSVFAKNPLSLSLSRRLGTSSADSQSWCRISPGGAIEAVLILDARDRKNITAGSPVNISAPTGSGTVISSTVQSVSAIRQDSESVRRASQYQVLCPLPTVGTENVLPWLGKECHAVFHLPHRSLADDLANWLQRWIDGEMS